MAKDSDKQSPLPGSAPNLTPAGARIAAAIEEAIEAMRVGRPLKTTFQEARRGRDEGEQTNK